MKFNIKIWIAVFAFITAFINKSTAQVEFMSNYVFSGDSVKGFDEPSASAAALANHCFGKEYKVFLFREKRAYIIQKYSLQPAPAQPITLFQNPTSSGRSSSIVGGACDNEDFELATTDIQAPGAVQGWSLQSGTTGNNNCSPPVLTATNLYTVFTAPVIDSRIPGQISSYFDANNSAVNSGHSFIRLNDDQAGAKAVRLTKAFIPNSNNALFQYAYIAVIEDGSHSCCDQAGFNIKITITNTVTNTSTLLACPNISVSVPGISCQFTIPPGGPVFNPCVGAAGWSYANWTASAIDLTQYINNLVKIDITVVDCDAGGHGAYFYFDAKCSPMAVTGNGNSFPAGQANVTVPTCGAAGATICATPGLGPYSWAGPGVFPPYDQPGMGNQCFTSTLSATYTLYMNPPGSCAPIARVISTTITPAPLLLASVVQAACGSTVAAITVTPSGSAANPSSLTWFPTPLTINSGTTQGTYQIGLNPYTVSITASDPLGCFITSTVSVNPAPPIPNFTLVNITPTQSITCQFPTVDVTAASTYSYNGGSLNFFWSSNSATFTTNTVTIVNSGTYQVIGTDPVTNCSLSKTLTIGINTVAPSVVLTPTFQNITCAPGAIQTVTAAATPSVNITHIVTFDGISGASLTATSHSLIFIPPIGTHTYVLRNDINGCETVRTISVVSSFGFPTFSISSSPPNFTLGCTTTSITTLNFLNPQANGPGQVPSGAPVSYTILGPPTSSAVPPSGPLGTNNTPTVNVAGTWTLIVRDNNSSCETRVPVSVLLNNLGPNISVLAERTILDCYNPRVTLQGQSLTNGSLAYSWGLPSSVQPGDTLSVPADFAHTTNSVVASYTLTITDQISTCKSTSVVPIYQNLYRPKAVISASANDLTCIKPRIILTNQSSPGSPANSIFPSNKPVVASLWEGPTPQDPLPNSTTYEGYTAGDYTMTVVDLNNGCTTFTTIPIINNKVYPSLTIDSIHPSVLDCGSFAPLKVTANNDPQGKFIYTWTAPPSATFGPLGVNGKVTSKGDSTSANLSGEYKVTVVNPLTGCVSQESRDVITGSLTVAIDADQVSGYAPLTVNFTNLSKSTNNASITSVWSFGTGVNQTFTSVAPTSMVYNQPGTYTVTLFARKGTCLESAQKIIKVEVPSRVAIPNVFTPNNDGVNDFFTLQLADNLSELRVVIYDRWGHLVYELISDGRNISWDGKNQYGKEVPEGTYFYTLKATGKDDKPYDNHGTINLFR